MRMYIAVDNFGDQLGRESVALLQHLYYLGSSPQGFLSSQNGFSLDPTGRLCATFGIFGSLTNIFYPSGHWSGPVTMMQVNTLSVLVVVRSGGADTTFHIYRLLRRACSLQRAAFTQ